MRWKWLRNGLLGLGMLVVVGFFALFFTFLHTRADRELYEIRQEIGAVRREVNGAKLAARETELRQRCLKLAKENPDTEVQLGALYVVAGEWPQTEEGKRALQTLLKVSETASLDYLGKTFDSMHVTHNESMRPLVPVLVRRERENPKHAYAAKLLTEACLLLAPNDSAAAAPDEFTRIANVIVERHATSPKLANFCEKLGRGDWSPQWAQPFESHLRRILEVNKDRFVRCSAKIALASIVQESGADRQPEAAKLYEEFLAEFDGTLQYSASGIEEHYREVAQRALEVIRSHGLGKHAPETIGIDLDGKPMALADYRGKVVLVSFWATWCFPCMKMIPHEKELVEHFAADKFAIVGVNGDTDIETAREAVEQYQIPWRSFRNNRDGQDQIDDQWHVAAWPTFYLLDVNGIVQKRWFGGPSLGDLTDSVQRLIKSQTGEIPTEVQPSVDREPGSNVQSTYPPIDVAKDTPEATGFVGKTYRPNGGASKYVVFIPHNYNAGTSVPAILFLHGAGLQGTDGRKQLTGALANAIRQRESSFPLIAVFPQAREGDWQDVSPDGKRAIAILDEVCSRYSVNMSRVFLTGLSMGGEGTWSLAAVHPDRWAAIVPICGGGDPAIARRIKHIPCWCFHGDSDRMIHPLYSRKMVEAIRKATLAEAKQYSSRANPARVGGLSPAGVSILRPDHRR